MGINNSKEEEINIINTVEFKQEVDDYKISDDGLVKEITLKNDGIINKIIVRGD